MRFWHCALAAALLTAAFGLPFREYPTQRLLPIRTLQAQRTPDGVYLRSEAGEGEGATWDEAVAALRKNAGGEVFFETTEHIVFSDADLARDAAASGILRPAAQVHFSEKLREAETANDYFSAHPSELRLSDFGIYGQEERME